jgi:hypothetical protein
MISFAALGQYGRLGNQMFQVAATLAVANRVNSKATFPKAAIIRDVFLLQDCQFTDQINVNFVFSERTFQFDDGVLAVPDSCNVHGYFQSEKYFEDREDLVLQNFTFKDKISQKANDKMSRYTSPVCSVHVRRGDYVNLSDTHPYVGDDYYKSAMLAVKERDSNVEFIVFSDDIEWCKSSKTFDKCQFVEEDNDAVELCMMSSCDYHIIANSSFSWWGSKLSKSKLTIAPKLWFGSKGPREWSDIYCKKWITL